MKQQILNFDEQELSALLQSSCSLEPYRAKQIIPWLYRKRETSFEAMTDIARTARELLAEHFTIYRPKLLQSLKSVDGSRKYLFQLEGGDTVETVLIKQPKRWTLCVSSQVGCAVACSFCVTGTLGLKRNLETHEILGQVLAVRDDIAARKGYDENGTLIDDFYNIVFMGMGEPFHNFDNVARAVRLLNHPKGFDFSPRKLTVSTSGIVPAIQRFADEEVGANLAISLNATTDEVRNVVIPINKRWPLSELLATLRDFPLKKGKRITIEYVMLAGVNDSFHDLQRLPKLLHGIQCKVNLIPYNDNSGLGYSASSRQIIEKWHQTLLDRGLNCTIRWSKGTDISAACGQLAAKNEPKKTKKSIAIT